MRNIVIIIIIVITLAGIYYGAYRPLVKAQSYIIVQRIAPTFQTFDEFASYNDRMFEYYSPIGDREIIKFFINNILGIITRTDQSEEIARAMVEYGESYIYENEVIQLLHMAYAYDVLWQRFGDGEYFEKTEFYYNRMNEIGPRLPHALYGLFNLYGRSGDSEKQRAIGEKILELWPHDEGVRKIIDSA